MDNFEAEQIAQAQTFDKFASPAEAVEKLTLLAVDLIQSKQLSATDKKIVADCVMDYVRIKTAQIQKGGRKRKWATMKEKNAFFNAKRRTKT